MLNADQKAAAVATDEVAVVIAGAGTGKTRTLISRVERLIGNDVPPDRILVVTFTNFAADEMISRMEVRGSRPFIGTLHAWAATVVAAAPDVVARCDGFSVYDEHDRTDVVRLAAEDHNVRGAATSRPDVLLRNQRTFNAYADRMRAANALDYDDLLDMAIRVLEEAPSHHDALARFRRIEHVLVDEAQDLSAQQWDLLQTLPGVKHLWVVGDPRQAIYRWRGARPDLLRDLAEDPHATVYNIADNYRSSQRIVELANSVAPEGYPGLLANRAAWPPRAFEYVAAEDEGASIRHLILAAMGNCHTLGEIAILGRTWKMLYGIARNLRSHEIPCQLHGGSNDPWSQPQGLALSRYIRLHLSPGDNELAAMVLRFCRPELDLRKLREEAARKREALSHVAVSRGALLLGGREDATRTIAQAFFEVLCQGKELCPSRVRDQMNRPYLAKPSSFAWWWVHGRSGQDYLASKKDDHIQMLTVHAAKGLEWPVVIVPGCNEGVYPFKSELESGIEESRSVFYVACTRARDYLHLTRSTLWWKEEESHPTVASRFLLESL